MDRLVGELLALPRVVKQTLAFLLDSAIIVWSVYAALYLRLGVWRVPTGDMVWAVLCALLIAIPLFVTGGLYRAIFRHAALSSALLLARAGLVYTALYSLIFTFWGLPGVPRTLGIIQPIILFIGIGASRAFAHYLLGQRYRRFDGTASPPAVVIYGAGDTGRALARSLRINRDVRVVGFIDDDASLYRGHIEHLPVLSRKHLDGLIEKHQVAEVLLALPSATRLRRREIVKWLSKRPVAVRSVPALNDLASGKVLVSEIRPIVIEDLLGRQPVEPDWELLKRPIAGRCVLITGAGGSIGSELARQILALQPHSMILVEVSEAALYQIDRELRTAEAHERTKIVPILASVRDKGRLDSIFGQYRPDTVFHAAAYKHVPLVEANYLEGMKNNFLGTKNVGEIAVHHDVSDFILISSDKAVRPTNLMGASKRLAELAILALVDRYPDIRFSSVRFGNVLNSTGSVVPLFKEQIEAGGPVTVTHPEMTRYFMTIPEAAQLVLQAAAMSQRGGDTFLLDMGNPVRIGDLAKLMIKLSNLSVMNREKTSGDIEISYVGLRPGEKLYEELLIGSQSEETEHPRIFKANEPLDPAIDLAAKLTALEAALLNSDEGEVMAIVKEVVEGYQQSGAIADVECGTASQPT
ncbi:polysaccharide biosynthesis protein [Qipengyuania sp. MTN3-11]|uniref:polysaccharide biosynthesis protein n=1 Tax=Qipengyuania sp. MTN3-11 TaxID=3056557 RepID=UPI0036F36622